MEQRRTPADPGRLHHPLLLLLPRPDGDGGDVQPDLPGGDGPQLLSPLRDLPHQIQVTQYISWCSCTNHCCRGQLASLNSFSNKVGTLAGLCLGLVVPIQVHTNIDDDNNDDDDDPVPAHHPGRSQCRLPRSVLAAARVPRVAGQAGQGGRGQVGSDQSTAGQGRWSLFRQTLVWLRGEKYDIEPEIKEMKAIIAEDEGAGSTGARALVQTATSRTFLLPLVIVCTLFIIQVTLQLTAGPGSGEEVCRCSAGRTSWTPTLWSSSRMWECPLSTWPSCTR